MNKKLVIGGVVLLLVIGGGAFLLFSGTETKLGLGESGSDTIPTQWSQAGDYEIKEVAGQQTVVTNSKAGFSFKVPEGWELKGQEYGVQQYFLNLLSSDSQLNEENKLLTQGCGMSLETLYQEQEHTLVQNSIARYSQDPQKLPDNEQVLTISNYSALKTLSIPVDEKVLQIYGEAIQIQIPFSQDGLIEFGIRMMRDSRAKCTKEFDKFIADFFIK